MCLKDKNIIHPSEQSSYSDPDHGSVLWNVQSGFHFILHFMEELLSEFCTTKGKPGTNSTSKNFSIQDTDSQSDSTAEWLISLIIK